MALEIDVVLLCPLDPTLPPFVLAVFPQQHMLSAHVHLRRWGILEQLLAERGMYVVTHGVDGAAPHLAAEQTRQPDASLPARPRAPRGHRPHIHPGTVGGGGQRAAHGRPVSTAGRGTGHRPWAHREAPPISKPMQFLHHGQRAAPLKHACARAQHELNNQRCSVCPCWAPSPPAAMGAFTPRLMYRYLRVILILKDDFDTNKDAGRGAMVRIICTRPC